MKNDLHILILDLQSTMRDLADIDVYELGHHRVKVKERRELIETTSGRIDEVRGELEELLRNLGELYAAAK